ncbi:hypothetical protein QMO56_16220 [Roseomonas sp. E05]|uniref:hypothetical protein n=1 Tax=Roseomonas sp. E05 TaxID=3046310 RepID=UPI0024BAC3C6|nr:hypothetical protein [Roseomonas sp. E05]MDJ0389661.1 hypothetical protein [Roseomonas sp. E05]
MVFRDGLKLVLAGLVAVLGLFIARSNAPLITTQHIGLGVFLLAVGYGLLMVKRHFDRTLSP